MNMISNYFYKTIGYDFEMLGRTKPVYKKW